MPSIADILKNNGDDFQKIVDKLCEDTTDDRSPLEYLEEYKGKRERRAKSVGMRQNKIVGEGSAQKVIKVAKLVFAYPKKIVRTAVAFLFGGEMTYSNSESDEGFKEFKRVWEKDLKMHSLIKRFARTVMTETKAAILFYPQTTLDLKGAKKTRLRAKLLTVDSGEFYPHFDDYGDMDAFIWKFSAKGSDGKEREHIKIYTSNLTISATKEDGDWIPKTAPNLFKKIPVVYGEQDNPEWEDVATLMDEFETRISRLADTNDYFAEPLVMMFGDAEGAPSKEEVGKMLKFEMVEDDDGKITHGDAKYLTWDQTPESIKLELETLRNGIFSMSSTPDLSFDNVKGIGNVTGIAMKLMFMDAILKASERDDLIEAVQRMVSVVKAGIGEITAVKYKNQLNENEIEVKFGSVLPDNLEEAVKVLVEATGGKAILSQKTAVSQSPFTIDAKEEINRLNSESEKDNQRSSILGTSYQ